MCSLPAPESPHESPAKGFMVQRKMGTAQDLDPSLPRPNIWDALLPDRPATSHRNPILSLTEPKTTHAAPPSSDPVPGLGSGTQR